MRTCRDDDAAILRICDAMDGDDRTPRSSRGGHQHLEIVPMSPAL
jgi:hypothetical protein